VEYTRDELAELFRPHDPEYVHEHIDPADMAKLLGTWKPRFIHSDRSKKLVRAVIEEAGFPAVDTHYDLPKPRTSFPVGHLTTGVAFAFPWPGTAHRSGRLLYRHRDQGLRQRRRRAPLRRRGRGETVRHATARRDAGVRQSG
jgi:hypothetical protein